MLLPLASNQVEMAKQYINTNMALFSRHSCTISAAVFARGPHAVNNLAGTRAGFADGE
jgi:hypothetical protein